VLEGHVLHPVPFLDITKQVLSGGERGLLGLAFHPDYRRNGRFFVNYTRKPDGATVLAEYQKGVTATSASQEERILLVVPQPYPNHNGGMVAFGPDGYLYVGLGDGGSKGDPDNRAQNPEDLLGKILRIDVDRGSPYSIPMDNPFAKEGGRPEIYAIGLRNPWRFSFDIKTGNLWVADVGQYKWEEIDVVTRGRNYGWRVMEGTHCFHPSAECQTTGLSLPLYEYSHEKGRCSIIGGYIYRGQAISSLMGTYVYGDFCSGEIFALQNPSRGQTLNEARMILKTSYQISSFGQDTAGEIYVLDHKGGVYRLSPP
jgi:glucose/arabinose dehydrogenase